MLALCKNIVQLEGSAHLLNEIVVVNNASTSNYEPVLNYINAHLSIPFKYVTAPDNLGVARGRNYALQFNTADIIIMLDDDAELGNKDALLQIKKQFEQRNTDKKTAIVSFKVLYFDTGQMQQNALPHKEFEKYKNKSFFETYYYAGGAHAILRSVLEETGKYPEDFFYGMEEYDLSYRILNKGYRIVYSDAIIMLHKESPFGRTPNWQKLQMMWVNKSAVAWKHLPFIYFLSTSLLWSYQYLRESNYFWPGFFSGWKKVVKVPFKQIRNPISSNTIDYLKKLKARLWY